MDLDENSIDKMILNEMTDNKMSGRQKDQKTKRLDDKMTSGRNNQETK